MYSRAEHQQEFPSIELTFAFCWCLISSPSVRKMSYRIPTRTQRKITQMQNTLNVRISKEIGQLPEVTASVAEHIRDIVCIQEHRYYHSEVEIKFNDTGNGWAFIFSPGWGCRNAYLSLHPKITHSIEKIQARKMVTLFNGKPNTTIISYSSPTNVNNETDLTTFFNELSSLVRSVILWRSPKVILSW